MLIGIGIPHVSCDFSDVQTSGRGGLIGRYGSARPGEKLGQMYGGPVADLLRGDGYWHRFARGRVPRIKAA